MKGEINMSIKNFVDNHRQSEYHKGTINDNKVTEVEENLRQNTDYENSNKNKTEDIFEQMIQDGYYPGEDTPPPPSSVAISAPMYDENENR
jgi:hypothetical protein